jgi:magnesium-transporting ATPase (P-type)
MSKTQKRNQLIFIILFWGFYLFFLKDSVQGFISDWHDLHDQAGTSAAHTKNRLVREVLVNVLLLASVILSTITWFKILKKKDDNSNGNPGRRVVKNRPIWIFICIVYWCIFPPMIYNLDRRYIHTWHQQDLQPMDDTFATGDKHITDVASANDEIASINKDLFKVKMELSIATLFFNLGGVYVLIMITKVAFKKNDDGGGGNLVAQN